MSGDRLAAFTDGVIVIIITTMVLELPVPHGSDLAALRPVGLLLASLGFHRPLLASIMVRDCGLRDLCNRYPTPLERSPAGRWTASAPLTEQAGSGRST